MSITIEPFSSSEVEALSRLSRQTFIESHGHSASAEDINIYIDKHFNTEILRNALNKTTIKFNKIFYKNQLAGYSKLILNETTSQISVSPVAKFERLYLLQDFYGCGLGKQLLLHNLQIAKAEKQKALWLYVWKENKKALKFYTKNNFRSIGEYDFKISSSHTNPNYVMLKML